MNSQKVLYSPGNNDECLTPDYGVKPLLKYLEPFRDKIIWCPFDTDGSQFVKIFKHNGFNVVNSHINNGEDFYTYEPDEWDLIVSNPPFCYDKDTEVLTDRGWLYFKDVSLSDKILSLNVDTQEIEWSNIENITNSNYEGEMIKFNSKTLDICVTPDHRMYAHNSTLKKILKDKNTNDLITAKNIKEYSNKQLRTGYKWLGKNIEFFIIPSAYIKIHHMNDEEFFNEVPVLIDDWLRFFGLWLADGSVRGSLSGNESGYAVSVTKNISEEEYIDSVFDKLPFKYHKEYEKDPSREHILHYRIYNKFFHNYMKQFGNSSTKFIPKELKNLSTDKLKILLDSYLNADSYKTDNGIMIGSRSLKLMNDIQEIILKLGDVVNFKPINGEYKYYQCHWNKNNMQTSKYKNKSSISYCGKIYCAELEKNGVMLVRRNYKTYFSGNSNKRKIFERALSFGKPFALLMANTWLNDAAPKQLFKDVDLQLLMFDRRIEYNNDKKITFSSSYFCRDFLPKQIICEKLEK